MILRTILLKKAKKSSQFLTVILQKLMDPEENFEKTLDSKFNWTRNVTSRNSTAHLHFRGAE